MVDSGADLPIRFGPDGLVPVVLQDVDTATVLMIGFMNREALNATRATGRAHFWSRSRGKLWRKGETSGHEQVVDEIFVNCEQNSLLITVRPLGAVCHDGYRTCYYRRLEPDGGLVTVQDRVFDPAGAYGNAFGETTGATTLVTLTKLQYAAYSYLRDHDLTAVSRTSALLRDPDDRVSPRVADELRELVGVLDGSHHHGDRQQDVILEGSQVIYWVLLAALRAGISWDRLRMDEVLTVVGEDQSDIESLVVELGLVADSWKSDQGFWDMSLQVQRSLTLATQAARTVGVDPCHLIEVDLAELRAKPYLAPVFTPTAPSAADHAAPSEPAHQQRLWTPWRMPYVGGRATEAGCLFCNRLHAKDDVASLLLHRGRSCYVIMNLYPYNTGHLMLVPNAHVPDPESADATALAEVATLLPVLTRALRRVLACDGFNVGLNIGQVAGAGVADHLHEHVVPRWTGDANYMPILAGTMVLPELIPITYAKLRAELNRELTGGSDVTLVVVDEAGTHVLVRQDAAAEALPTATAEPETPLWRAAIDVATPLLGHSEIAGWAGSMHAGGDDAAALTLRPLDAHLTPRSSQWLPIREAADRLVKPADRLALQRALAQLPPRGAQPR